MRRTLSLLGAAALGVAGFAWHAAADVQKSQAIGNLPPVCCIGPNCQLVGLIKITKCGGDETVFVLDGSGSYDPEGQPLTFQWTSCPGSTIDDPTAPVTLLRVDTSTSCSQICGVRLKVSDGQLSHLCRIFVETIDNTAICGGKPQQIEMTYTGEGCGASNHAQDPAGVTCIGDPLMADPVHIVVTMESQPNRVYFDGIVNLNAPFVIDGAGQPSGKVPPNSRVSIFDPTSGALLQETTFHTSCSQPLEVGDQFGAAIITDFTP